MSQNEQDDLLAYYQRELAYLRHEGAEFAQLYPGVAARLELGGGESPDPHVERLLESFAFLTARIQRSLRAEFPQIPAELLGVLYPHLVAPVPSMAIAHFEVDPDQARAAKGFDLPSGTALFAEISERDAGQDAGKYPPTCRFRTGYPLTLWPIEVVDARIQPKDEFDFLDHRPDVGAVLRVTLRAMGKLTFAELAPERLRFHLNADPVAGGALYEQVLNRTVGLAVRPVTESGLPSPVTHLDPRCIQPVGFGVEEGLLPWPEHAHQAYRLLQEYFTFPQKFLFVDLLHMKGLGEGKQVEIFFLLEPQSMRLPPVRRDTIRLNCTPIINLFVKTAEPVRLDQTQVEYRLQPDFHLERMTEIHSILSVSARSTIAGDSRVFQPFYSYHHDAQDGDESAYWSAQRRPTRRADMPGTDMVLSFLDLNFRPTRPPAQVVFAQTLCTNRGLAEQLPPHAPMEWEVSAPISTVYCLAPPTRQIRPPMDGQTLWRLVSHLSLNHLSLDGEHGLDALCEILRLYAAYNGGTLAKQLAGIKRVSSRTVVRRIRKEAWRGFCQGTEVTLEVDEDEFGAGHPFLLASVLNHFFSLHAAVNAFTQTRLVGRRNGEWKTWDPLAGGRPIL